MLSRMSMPAEWFKCNARKRIGTGGWEAWEAMITYC